MHGVSLKLPHTVVLAGKRNTSASQHAEGAKQQDRYSICCNSESERTWRLSKTVSIMAPRKFHVAAVILNQAARLI